MASTSNNSAEEKSAIFLFLPKPGKLPDESTWHFPCLEKGKKKKESDLDDVEAETSGDQKGAPPLRSSSFAKPPKFSLDDFFVVSPEESHRDQDIYFTREQDNTLVRAVLSSGAAQWDYIRRIHPTLRGISKSLLLKRWEMLNLSLEEDEELAMKTGPDGEEIISISNMGEMTELETGSKTSVNEDLCAICQVGGELLCCDSCPLVYHLKCLGLAEVPEDEVWNCPECFDKCQDIIDDAELKDDDWQQYTETFGAIGNAMVTAKKNPEIAAGEDGTITQALINVVQANDANFERITAEIEKQKGFKSQSLMEAENQLLAAFAEKEKTEGDGEGENGEEEGDDVDMEDDDDKEDEEDHDEEKDESDNDDTDDRMEISRKHEGDKETGTHNPKPEPKKTTPVVGTKSTPAIGTTKESGNVNNVVVNMLQPRRKKN